MRNLTNKADEKGSKRLSAMFFCCVVCIEDLTGHIIDFYSVELTARGKCENLLKRVNVAV